MTEPGTITCTTARERSAAFLLADLDGGERAEVVAHLAGCPACRSEVSSLSSTLDAVTGVVEPVEPSPGFADRFVAGLPWAEEPEAIPAPTPIRTRRRRVARAAAATAVAAAIGIGVAVSVGDRGHPAPARPVTVADLRTADGGHVGEAVVVGRTTAEVSVGFDVAMGGDRTSYDGRYSVVAVLQDGGRVPLGTVLVTDGRGGLQARTSLTSAEITTIKVQGKGGRDLCAGLLPPPPIGG